MSDTEAQDSRVAGAFEELRTARVLPPDPMPFVRASVSRRRKTRRVAVGGACLIAAASAAAVLGTLGTGDGDPTPIATDSSVTGTPSETTVDLSSPGAESAQIRDVTVRCRVGEVQGRDVALLTIESLGRTAPLLRLQTEETALAEGTTITLPLDDTGGSTAQAPALFEVYAALRGAEGGLEATSTSPASRGTLTVVSSSCDVGEPVAIELDVWLGPESGDQAIHVVGRVAGTVVD